MKLEHTTTRDGDFFEITDTHGHTISLDTSDALLVCDWLYQRKGEIVRLVNEEREEIAREIAHEQNERSITRSHFDSDAAWESWNVDHPQ